MKCNYSRPVWAWALYDWANSAFILSVATAFFPGFFKNFWCVAADPSISTIRLGYGNMAAGLLVALLSPVFGALAGAGRYKKKFLVAFMILGVLATSGLYLVQQGAWVAALMLLIGGRVGFSMANLFYDAFLPDICSRDETDMVSSLGFAVGYLGCGLFFVFNSYLYNHFEQFGLASGADAIRVIFLLTALWWLLFSIPLLRRVHQRTTVPVVRRGFSVVVKDGLSELAVTARAIASDRNLMLFLIAYWLYIDGVHTVYLMATDFGLSIGIPFSALMGALLAVQFVAFVFAMLFGWMASKTGARAAVLSAIGVYLVVTLGGAWVMKTAGQFIFFACLTGLAQGGIQALSRSMFIRMVPPAKSVQFVGFYNMIGKFSLILGPGIVATANLVASLAGFRSVTASRFGISTLSILFVAGAVLLVMVHFDKPVEN